VYDYPLRPERAALRRLCSGFAKEFPAMQPTGWPHTRTDHRLSAREVAVKSLRFLRLNRLAARLYYRHIHGFASAGRELPAVIRRCLRRAVDTGTAQRGDYYEFGVFLVERLPQSNNGRIGRACLIPGAYVH
jgi:hypothetical protein